MEKNNWRQEDLNEDQLIVLNRTIPPEYYQYKLKGVVVHDGMADYGHYYSFIRDREDADGQENWYTFNDTIVEPFDVKNLPHETFGGEHENYESQVNRLQGDPAMQ
jgi:ubiquitin C-terminal hydrolase